MDGGTIMKQLLGEAEILTLDTAELALPSVLTTAPST